MLALAIDTSTYSMGVALVDGDNILAEVITNLKKNHSIRLMPAIEKIMKEVEIKPNELQRVIVAEGPGSYTGVRIGVTTAKTLAWTLGIPLVGVSTLEVLAQNGKYSSKMVAPIIDARRGQVFTGLYGNDKGTFKTILDDRICLFEDWAKQLKQMQHDVLFLGNDLTIHREVVEQVFGSNAQIGLLGDHQFRPSELARLGLKKAPVDNIHQFSPNYLRLAEAEANWLASQQGEK